MPDAQADHDVEIGLVRVQQARLEDRVAAALGAARFHLHLLGEADRGLVDRADLAEHRVRLEAAQPQHLGEAPRLLDQADAGGDADALRADPPRER